MATIQVYGSNVGGLIQGEYGNYTPATDGTYIIDSRDLYTALRAGCALMAKNTESYTTPGAVTAATAGQFAASAAISNGPLAIANQPDTPRPGIVVMGNGTAPITAGSVAMTYYANDGTTQTDTFSCILGASAGSTMYTSKGVVHISTMVISGLVGGTSPFVYIGTGATVSLPVNPNATDFAVLKENVTGVDEAVGALFTATLGSITPTSAPNGTRTFSFLYTFFGPIF